MYMNFFGNQQSFESRAEKALLKFRDIPKTGISLIDARILNEAWEIEMGLDQLVRAHSLRYMTEWKGGMAALSRLDQEGDLLIEKIKQTPVPSITREEAVTFLEKKLMEICPSLQPEYANRQAILEVAKAKANFAA